MQPDLILQEDGFCLEFRSINKLSLLDEFPQLAEGMVGDAGYVLQEMIILPPYMVGQANNYSAKTVAPLQNEPTDYGKLFSRAVAVGFPQSKLLLISGTAAIDKAGSSVYIGNFKSQMAFTLEVVSAILSQEKGSFSNVAQAIIYLKRSKDRESCLRILDGAGFPRARALFQLDVDICRDNLLCEI
jgi:enamine deaminase RidA (YjgF/YER057c/UK114 family)